jgi:hypothetical protein
MTAQPDGKVDEPMKGTVELIQSGTAMTASFAPSPNDGFDHNGFDLDQHRKALPALLDRLRDNAGLLAGTVMFALYHLAYDFGAKERGYADFSLGVAPWRGWRRERWRRCGTESAHWCSGEARASTISVVYVSTSRSFHPIGSLGIWPAPAVSKPPESWQTPRP